MIEVIEIVIYVLWSVAAIGIGYLIGIVEESRKRAKKWREENDLEIGAELLERDAHRSHTRRKR